MWFLQFKDKKNNFKNFIQYSRIIPIERKFENTVRIKRNVCYPLEISTQSLILKRILYLKEEGGGKYKIQATVAFFSLRKILAQKSCS